MIELDPNRIRLAPGYAGKAAERRRNETAPAASEPKPARAHVNHIPAHEVLMTMIRSAVSAFRRGAVWDRGSILNLLV